ncbi:MULTISPECIES: glycosyltransferase [unclassified Solwaraspora]|uniref:glycosyltransferase n=1 Tax=unclassified Solwaraspora TaxID=2627926 RepID=UPI00259BCF67|nr:glycosyltransferase [Solwaraspora sp. WMMA2056]WJK40728.1 glycosyltransferase [Solwaraspora sp. WMMA2056]
MTPSDIRQIRFYERLGGSWRDLADHLGIPPVDQARFVSGYEARGIWHWLDERDLRDRLPAALRAVRRPDLAELLGSVQPPADRVANIVSKPYDLLTAPDGLVGRTDILATLKDFAVADSPARRIVVLRAVGGMGKSAIAWTFWDQIVPALPLADRPEVAVWWSFTDLDGTVSALISKLADQASSDVAGGPVERAVHTLLNRRCLLVIDALERQLEAFSSMVFRSDLEVGQQPMSDLAGDRRRIVDPRLVDLLSAVRTGKRSQIVITSRLMPINLEAAPDRPRYGVELVNVPPLTTTDGQRLLSSFGLPEDKLLMARLDESTGMHPLLLQLAARFLASRRVDSSEIVTTVATEGLPTNLKQEIDRARATFMNSILQQLSSEEVLVAQVVAASTQPLATGEVRAMVTRLSTDPIDVPRVLGSLADLSLVASDRRPLGDTRWAIHPVVQGAIRALQTATAPDTIVQAVAIEFTSALNRAYTDVRGISDLQRPIELFNALCSLQRYDDAAIHYIRSLHQPLTFACPRDHQERLILIGRLFPNGWRAETPIGDSRLQSIILNAAALAHQWVGQNRLAADLLKRAVQAEESKQNATLWSNLASILMYTDDLAEAYRAAMTAIRCSWGSGESRIPITYLALILRQAGRPADRLTALLKAPASGRISPAWRALRLGDLALWNGKPEEALALGEQSLAYAQRQVPPFEASLIEASRLIGQSLVALSLFDEAVPVLEEALRRTRDFAIVQEELPIRVSLARALLIRSPERVERIIADGFERYDAIDYRWFTVEAELVLADLHQRRGDADRAAIHRRSALDLAVGPDGWSYVHGPLRIGVQSHAGYSFIDPQPAMAEVDQLLDKFQAMADTGSASSGAIQDDSTVVSAEGKRANLPRSGGYQGAAPPTMIRAQTGFGHRRQILAIGTEWRSGNGGLSTLNRDLCTALAAAGQDVTCLVLFATDADRAAAEAGGVRLLIADSTPGGGGLEALSRRSVLRADYVPEVIIGHGRITGPAAFRLAEDYPQAKRLHVIHMAPDEIEWYKAKSSPGSETSTDVGALAEDRLWVELELARDANLTAAVGPRLFERYQGYLHEAPTRIVRLDPGFDTGSVPHPGPPPGQPWRILVVGRAEDARLKGLDLAAQAVAQAVRYRDTNAARLELVVRGAPDRHSAELRNSLLAWAGPGPLDVVVLPYSLNEARLSQDLRAASLVLMPSRKEGFGLVGVEAIKAGVPVLISRDTGLGELLKEVWPTDRIGQLLVPITGDNTEDAPAWGRAIDRALGDREAAFARAEQLRVDLIRQRSWASTVAGLLAELG